MQYIVKITKYKKRMSVNIPAQLIRDLNLKDFEHILMNKIAGSIIMMKGYKDGEKIE